MVCPTPVIAVVSERFSSEIAGAGSTGTRTVDGGDTGGVSDPGGTPVAVAVLLTDPPFTSAWVRV